MMRWVPKSFGNQGYALKNHSGDPFGAQGAPGATPGPPEPLGIPAFFDFLGRPWSPQGSLLDPRGEPEMLKNRPSEYRSALWHPQKSQKTPLEGGSEMGQKK